MSSGPTVVVAKDAAVLAHAVAARLLTRLADAQAARGEASVVLAGGTIAIAALRAVAASPARDAVDWRRVDVWWGDERFVASDDPERNELQAREALLDQLPLVPSRVHPMGFAGGLDRDDADAAAARYVQELGLAASGDAATPEFDVVLLGMGPEGHTASIFPESPAAYDERPAFGVHHCPKPPPTRISLGFSALSSARDVWMVVSGAEKASAVAAALSGTDRVQLPAAGPRGRESTLWLLDEDTASALPKDLRRR